MGWWSGSGFGASWVNGGDTAAMCVAAEIGRLGLVAVGNTVVLAVGECGLRW